MKKKYFLPVVAFALCVFFSRCKKESEKKEYCRITKLIKNGNEEIDIKFGDNEKISSIENNVTKELSTYKYEKDTVFISASKNGTLLYKLVVTNNKDHFAKNVLMQLGPNEWINQAFTYEGRRIVHNNATNSDGESETASYIWENGNIDVLVNVVETTHFEYYPDKNFQDGDFLAVQQLLVGYRIYEYKNLLKSMETNNNKTYYTYLFDEKGRVSEVTATSNNPSISYKIEYDCQ
jgi:uncharacterized lipoprotein YehR (DUF1307 family)